MKVSVIVTSYNYGKYIERCLRSLLNQNFSSEGYEVIVIDDASTDNSVEIIRRYQGEYNNLKLIVNEVNKGVAESGNIAIRQAMGQFVVRVDADDYVNSNFVKFLSEYLEANNGLLGVACDYVKVDNNEEVLERFYAKVDPISCGIMYRKDMLVEAGLYNSDFRHCEERELRMRLGDKYHVDNLKIPLYRYRIHGENKTTQVDKLKQFNERIEKLHGAEDGGVVFGKYVVAVMPARGGSKRLKKKNIYDVLGKPMLAWGVEACRKSKYVSDVYVTSESDEILRVAETVGAKPIVRPQELAEDHVFKMHPIIDAVDQIIKNPAHRDPDIVVVLQPNTPDVDYNDIDAAIEKLIKHSKQEIFSVDKDLNQNAAFRILTREAVFQKDLSTNCGVFVTDYSDIHTEDDVKVVERKMTQ